MGDKKKIKKINKSYRLDEYTLKKGLEVAKGGSAYGVKFDDMNKDELKAMAALGWLAFTKEGEFNYGRG